VAAAGAWDADGVYVSGLHAGDLGWHLRSPDEDVEGTLHGWWRDGDLVAAGLLEGGWSARVRLAPGHVRSFEVAESVRSVVDGMTGEQVWADAAHGSSLRQLFLRHGWVPDAEDPWVTLHRGLGPGAAAPAYQLPEGLAAVRGGTDVAARVHVQRQGFERSTFDEERWHRMAAAPGFRPELDVLLLDDGAPCAVATAWLPPGGGTALLEPVAVHRDHRAQGLGRAVVEATVEACRLAGASGVSVSTPESNTAAVAAYRAAGFVAMESLCAVTTNGGG
jgi:GNAT superfamily N-acetyltransferase